MLQKEICKKCNEIKLQEVLKNINILWKINQIHCLAFGTILSTKNKVPECIYAYDHKSDGTMLKSVCKKCYKIELRKVFEEKWAKGKVQCFLTSKKLSKINKVPDDCTFKLNQIVEGQ